MSENKENFIIETLKFSLIAILIVLPFRIFIAQPFLVSGASMSPNFETGHYLIVDQLSYNFEEPQRGEVIVFRYPKDPKKFFIKRIIGLPNEVVILENKTVTIKNINNPDGFKLSESYVKNFSDNNMKITLSEGEYFVMGDNRPASSDSRSWGVLQEDLIIGRSFLRLFPFNEIELFPEYPEDF
ncbi:MAG: signal peptidase I [Candidatus Pacebacteria bacterium]|nr:signal peptidase I [Candidatus Paceibacterota bacterium]